MLWVIRLNSDALLALENGTVFYGTAIGAEGRSVGEVVFNTSFTGYQEILTDPSYCRQIVTLTYPHIGNVGVNREDSESHSIHVAGLVVRDVPFQFSNWRAENSLSDYLKMRQIIGIAGIDTRKLTRILREQGAQKGCLLSGTNLDVDHAIRQARAFSGLKGMDLAQEVSVKAPYEWHGGSWQIGQGYMNPKLGAIHIVAYDFGVKSTILRLMSDRGCRLTVVPAQTPAEEVLTLYPHAIFLSNGPGDPEPCDYAITAIRTFLELKIPLFGICLGHQLLGLAAGARTIKMKFGHHGANHPVQDLETGRVFITSQNHGFAVDESTLPDNVRPTHRSLFDASLQGISFTDRPAFGFQGHPEAGPGPNDIKLLFDRFIQLIEKSLGG